MNRTNKKSVKVAQLETAALRALMVPNKFPSPGSNFRQNSNKLRLNSLQKEVAAYNKELKAFHAGRDRSRDTPPSGQGLAKRSPTGASFNRGFDAISPPDVRDQRMEDFDELIATVTGQTAFTITQFAMNPGNSTTFPRLSKIAQLFEKYRFETLEFYFQHDVSQFAAQGAQGLVILSALYDAASSAPTTKTQIEATKPRVICMPNQNSLLRCSKTRMHPQNVPLYIRPGVLPGGSDIKTYDVGNMFLTVQGMAGAGEVGELHVRGKVMLMDEILDSSSLASPSNNSVSQFSQVSTVGGATTVASVIALATADFNGLTAVNTAGSIVPPAGNYLLDITDNVIFSQQNQFDTTELQIKKNGSQLNNQVSIVNWPAVSTEAGSLSHHLSAFVQCNGSDAITFVSTDTYAAGTASHTTSARIVAL